MKKIMRLSAMAMMLCSLVGCTSMTKKTSSTSASSSTKVEDDESDSVSKTRMCIICHGYQKNGIDGTWYCNTEGVVPGDIVAINPKDVATIQVIPMGTNVNHYHLAVSFYIE